MSDREGGGEMRPLLCGMYHETRSPRLRREKYKKQNKTKKQDPSARHCIYETLLAATIQDAYCCTCLPPTQEKTQTHCCPITYIYLKNKHNSTTDGGSCIRYVPSPIGVHTHPCDVYIYTSGFMSYNNSTRYTSKLISYINSTR